MLLKLKHTLVNLFVVNSDMLFHMPLHIIRLHIFAPLFRDKFEVNPQTVPYLAALVSVSEEVRSRCHLKHRTSQYMMTESPSSDSLTADLTQPVHPATGESPATQLM